MTVRRRGVEATGTDDEGLEIVWARRAISKSCHIQSGRWRVRVWYFGLLTRALDLGRNDDGVVGESGGGAVGVDAVNESWKRSATARLRQTANTSFLF